MNNLINSIVFLALDWSHVVQKQHKEHMDKIDQLERKLESLMEAGKTENGKLDILLEAVQALSSKISVNEKSVIQFKPHIRLPNLPFRDIDAIVRFNAQLIDPIFMDQMVTYI